MYKRQAQVDAVKQQQQLQQQQMQQMQQAQQAANQRGMRQRRGGNSGLSQNEGMFMLMRQFDANGNGQLDPQEMQAMKSAMAQMQAGGTNLVMAQQLQQFDTNGNGQLDPAEAQAMQGALTRGGGQVGGAGIQIPGQGLPKNR